MEFNRRISTLSTISSYDEVELQNYRDKLFDAIEKQDIAQYTSIIQDNKFKKCIKVLKLNTSENASGYTHMQLASKSCNPKFVEGLLKINVNANCRTDDEEYPVLIASRLGNWRVLETFRTHNERLTVKKFLLILLYGQNMRKTRCYI